MTEHYITMFYITKYEKRRSNSHDAPLPHCGGVT